jgi:copper resistance protein B
MRRPIFFIAACAAALMAAPAYAQHEGHETATEPPTAPDGAPPWDQAEAFYGEAEMAAARRTGLQSHGNTVTGFVMADRLEFQSGDDEDLVLWDLQGWRGGDLNKLWVKAEGAYGIDDDAFEEAEAQMLWSRAISPFFDLQAGVRQTVEPDARTDAVIGIQGLAPQWFEVDVAAFIGEDITARAEAEYDLTLSPRLVLQPRLELELAADDIPELGLGSGLTHAAAGVRLRYELSRQFAPYVGVEWQAASGETGDLIEAAGGESEQTVLMIGLRAWR